MYLMLIKGLAHANKEPAQTKKVIAQMLPKHASVNHLLSRVILDTFSTIELILSIHLHCSATLIHPTENKNYSIDAK